MNEVCIEHCAVKRDCSAFEPKPNLKLGEMPRFPREELASMTKEEKFTTVTVYLSKIMDHLQGVDDEYPIRRGDLYRARSRTLPQDIKIQDLLLGVEEANCTPEDRSEHPNSPDRLGEVDEQPGHAEQL